MYTAGMEFLLDAVDRFPIREEFANNLGQPDPVPLHFLLENGGRRGNVDGADSDGGSALAENVGGDGDGAAVVGSRRKHAASPTRSAQSSDRVNPEAPGWTKRLRLGSATPDRVPCPSRMSALELLMRKYPE
ncbi:uncharacterized protein [Triticum aestivum]|uniref:uncharacterized protein n=1 Tax=Triticum aestivum TaxID=4565 RepID=UPI001D013A2E|nr:uncharacterized protein LOC123072269 [Triticum aestivum]